MSLELLYAIASFVFIMAIGAYFFIKDRENSLKIRRLEAIIEEMNKSLHFVKKDLEVVENTPQAPEIDLSSVKAELKAMLDKEVNSKILPILKSLQGFERVVEDLQNEQENRLTNLEQKAQNMTKLSPDFAGDETKIAELFKGGKSVEQIAKDLRISTGNVEFTLKMKGLL